MSKIGRRPINTKDVQIDIQGHEVHFKGKKSSGVHVLPSEINVEKAGDTIVLTSEKRSSDVNRIWGLNRALLANKIIGAQTGFEQKVIITGLGFKADLLGNKLVFSLGYSHKIDLELPEGITVETDKTKQILTVKGSDKTMVGQVSSHIRSLRPPEPYKGTGIKLENEVLIRKAGKTKSS